MNLKYLNETNPKNLSLGFILVTLFIVGFYGWAFNLQKIMLESLSATEQVVRILGVVLPPVGAVVGWF